MTLLRVFAAVVLSIFIITLAFLPAITYFLYGYKEALGVFFIQLPVYYISRVLANAVQESRYGEKNQ